MFFFTKPVSDLHVEAEVVFTGEQPITLELLVVYWLCMDTLYAGAYWQ